VGDACRGLGRASRPDSPLPVISGNVSFYNQSASGRAVAPSPIVACIGIVDDYGHCRSQRFKAAGELIYLIGRPAAELKGSLYHEAGYSAGRPEVPRLDFGAARAEIAAVLSLVRTGLATAVHDISDGGLAVCLAEMAMGLEGQRLRGASLEVPSELADLSLREVLFGERGGFLLTCRPQQADEVEKLIGFSGAAWWRVGEVSASDTLSVAHPARDEHVAVSVSDLATAWQGALPSLMGGVAAAAAVPPPAGAANTDESVEDEVAAPQAITVRGGEGPRIAVLQLPGVNCELESAYFVNTAGGEAEIFRWTRPAAELARFDGYLIPGGFSYQDRVRAGAVAAKDPLLEVLLAAAAAGKPILGICNGCQVLVESGLVPGLEPGRVEVALAANRFAGRRGYYSRWVNLQPVASCRSPFVEGLQATLPAPVAHAEGRFTHEDPAFFDRLLADGYVALRYVDFAAHDLAAAGKAAAGDDETANPNGSLVAAAALTNGAGNVLAMMPHPERAALLRMVPEDLPHVWGRRRAAAAQNSEDLDSAGPGLVLLRRLVELC
jgi:phosphoribosylformylglycinamidine synthase I